MYGLAENEILQLQRVFAKYEQIEKVLVFGSRSKGTYRTESDLDITMLGTNLSVSLLDKIVSDIAELNLPYETDLSIFETIDNPLLQASILQRNCILYKKD